jgi:hypothetical protein
MSETNEILSMTVASIKTLRNKSKQSKNLKSKIQEVLPKIPQSKIQNPKSKIE